MLAVGITSLITQRLAGGQINVHYAHGKFVLPHKAFTRKGLLVNAGHLIADAV